MTSDPDESTGAAADGAQAAPTTELALVLAVMRYLEKGVRTWTLLSTVAHSLNVEIAAVQRAAKVGVDNGWMILNGDPGNAVCLTDYGSVKCTAA